VRGARTAGVDTGLDRGRRLYDWWARHVRLYRLVERLSAPIRERALAELDLEAGETVVDVGCGPGGSLAGLAEGVGPTGRVVALDLGAEMTRRSRRRATTAGLGPVEVVRGDAAGPPLPDGGVDAAFASLALSAMPDAADAVAALAAALAPGGRLVVVDGRAPGGSLAAPVRWLYERVANWQGTDVVGLLRSSFGSVEVVAEYDAGTAFVAVATPA